MTRFASILIAGVAAVSPAAPALAQSPQVRAESDSRFRIGQMERLIEGAVEHAETLTRDRLKAVLPGDTVMTGENARVRGFRLEGYGVFFDVLVPPFDTETTLAWSVRSLDRNDLGLNSALNELRTFVTDSGNLDLAQAFKRVELQVSPGSLFPPQAPDVPNARQAAGSAAAVTAAAGAPPDAILNDPNEAYRTEVVQALKDVMLDYSGSLNLGPGEWLTVAARGNYDRPRLAPADSDARTRILRLKGSDLAAFATLQISREEALKRIELKEF